MSEEKMRASFEAEYKKAYGYDDGCFELFDGHYFDPDYDDAYFFWRAAWQAALQESEAGAVKAFRHKDTHEIRYALSTPPHDETEWDDVYISTAPQSAQAIETAAIIRAANECITGNGNDEEMNSYGKCFAKAILALIPQDGRTQLEEFGMKVADKVYGHFGVDPDREQLRSIVTNLIGAAK